MSFMKIDFAEVIAVIVESMLPTWSGQNLGLLMTIDARYTLNIGRDNEDQIRQDYSFLIQRPMNYTQVYFRDHKALGWKPLIGESTQWLQLANHDSCWREGFERMMNYKHQEAFDTLKVDWICDPQVSQYISFGINGSPKLVRVMSEKISPLDREDRRYVLNIKPVTLKEAVLEMKESQ